MTMHVETVGEGPRVVLVHGSMGGAGSWQNQKPLAERFRLEILTRPGFSPNPPEPRIDFERDAKLVADHLGDGAHLIGHSYGGIICLLAAAMRPEAILSLTVTEPDCFDVARGHPKVEEFIAAADRLYASDLQDPRAFAESFVGIFGLTPRFPDPLPANTLQAAQALMVERLPWEAQIPLADLRRASFPKLVVSGAITHPALTAVCDVLEEEIKAQRAILSDTDHRIMFSPDLNGVLEGFLSNAAR